MASLPLLLLAACTPEACPEPAVGGVPAMGDVNADGQVDLADGQYLQRRLFGGGPAPACDAAADLIPDGQLDAADSFAAWGHAFAGGELPPLADGACEPAPSRDDDPGCGRYAFEIDAPRKVTDGFDATVLLTARDLAVQGWQISLAAEGCAITSATLAGTAGADTGAGGLRRGGYGRVDLAGGGVVSAVALGWLGNEQVEAGKEPTALLVARVAATTPASGCEPCTLTFEDGLVGAGRPVRNLVTRQGYGYRPAAEGVTVKVCGG